MKKEVSCLATVNSLFEKGRRKCPIQSSRQEDERVVDQAVAMRKHTTVGFDNRGMGSS